MDDPGLEDYKWERHLRVIEKRVPTNDDDVRRRLRELGELAEVRDESKEARRRRLVQLIARQEPESSAVDHESEEPLITDAGPKLLSARESIASYNVLTKKPVRSAWEDFDLYASQAGFGRPVSAVHFGDSVLVGDYSGELTMLDSGELSVVSKDSSNSGRIGDIAANSELTLTGDLAGNLHIYKPEIRHSASLAGHKSRITSVDIHPSSRFFISASADSTWRLWDLDESLLTQGGHTGAINCGKISCDGCMVGTAGSDHDVRIWDLRNGLPITVLSNHAEEVLTLCWDPCHDYSLATAGADNRCLLWDLRNAAKPQQVIYAHCGAITDVVLNGEELVTASTDETVKIWHGNELKRTHEMGTKITSISVASGLVAGRWDRQVDLLKLPENL